MGEIWFQIFYQSLGIIAAVFNVGSYQFKKNKHYLLMQVISAAFFTTQFAIGHAWAAMFLNAMSGVRAIVYIILDNKSKKSHVIAGIFIAIINAGLALISYLFFNEYWFIALIIGLAQVVGTVALIINSPKVIRWVQLCFVSPCWLFNNIFYASLGGIITESTNIISIIVSLIRFREKNIKSN